MDTIWAIERVDTVKDAHRLSPVATAHTPWLVAIVRDGALPHSFAVGCRKSAPPVLIKALKLVAAEISG